MRMFDEQVARKPDLYPWTKDFIKTMHNGFWTSDEFSFSSDIHDFKTKLSEQEKDIVVRALSAIGQIEIAVKTFWAKIGDNLPHPSIRDMGYVMANVEVIHNYAYEKLLEVLGLEDIFEENLKLDFIEGRVKYLKKYTHKYYSDNKKQFIYSLILFTLFVENVSLFSQFYVVNWFGRRNLLKDTNQQTSYTVQEENIHAQAGIKIINTLREEYPDLFDKDLELKILHEAEKAFEAESKIIDWMVGDIEDISLSKKILKEFIKNRINISLEQIGYNPNLFEVDKKILESTEWFDEQIYGNSMTDFFHSRPVEYNKKDRSFSADQLF